MQLRRIPMKTLSNSEIRINNAKLIINALERYQSLPSRDIALLCGISPATVFNITSILKDRNLIVETGALKSSGGRRAQALALSGNYGLFIGLSITWDVSSVIAMNLNGEMINSDLRYIHFDDSSEFWNSVLEFRDHFLTLLRETDGVSLPILGTCISVPGIVSKDGYLIVEVNSPNRKAYSLTGLYRVFGKEVHVYNSGKLASLPLLYQENDIQNAVYVMLSRHIYGSLIHNNELSPISDSDCQFGSMILSSGGSSESSAPRTFYSYCSASHIIGLIREKGELNTDYPRFFQEIKDNSEYQKMWDEYLEHLSVGIHNIRCAFGTTIVLGGEMAAFISPYFDLLSDKIQKYHGPYDNPRDFLTFSQYGEYDEAVGAALYERRNFLEQQLQSLD